MIFHDLNCVGAVRYRFRYTDRQRKSLGNISVAAVPKMHKKSLSRGTGQSKTVMVRAWCRVTPGALTPVSKGARIHAGDWNALSLRKDSPPT